MSRDALADYKVDLRAALVDTGFDVQSNHDGIRVTLYAGPLHPPVYVHAQPWARGWSVFVSETTCDGSHDWRNVPKHYLGLQHPVYAPRDTTGPENVPISTIVTAVSTLASYIKRLAAARTKRFIKSCWYWPRSALESTKSANKSSEH